NLAGLCFFEQALHQSRRLFAQCFQLKDFQSDGLAALGVGGLVDRADVGVCELAEYFKAPDFVRHYLRSLMKTNSNFPSVGKTSGTSLGGTDLIRIVRRWG